MPLQNLIQHTAERLQYTLRPASQKTSRPEALAPTSVAILPRTTRASISAIMATSALVRFLIENANGGQFPRTHAFVFYFPVHSKLTGIHSKHMDKHDRPYRCPHPSCAKLQGFTYSGGLLRHEREVHGKHGGPKSQLMCPFTDCKRHSGKGFTRKENLNEHLRRVHQGKETVSQQDPLLERNSAEVAPGADGDETQMSHLSTGVKHEMSQLATGVKRKRSMPPQSQDEYGASHLVETSEQELARLRADNALQADRIRQLEATVAMNAEEMQRLKETMNLWAQQTGGQNHHVQHEQQQQQQQHQQHQQHQELDHQQHEEHHQQQTEEHHHHDHHHPFAQHQQIVEQLLEYAQPQDAEQQQHEDQKFAEQLVQQAEPVVQQENTLAAEVKAAFAAQEA